jgi:hypothetical protein
MSQTSQVVAEAGTIDWKVVAGGIGVFVATIVTSILGWMQGKKKVENTTAGISPTGQVQSAVLMETVPLRENTAAVSAVRDQLFLNHHAQGNLCKAIEDNTSAMDDVLIELKSIRRALENRG